ncbi:alpha/beta hydrolase [Dokdonella sp.]|uniref:alpha/beta hydrolase n=1 Tax=Dokdonella sp. TaxID=2291710 RepID=UPI003529410B
MFLRASIQSIVLLCAIFVTPQAPATETVPAHETLQIESRELGETRVVNVWLPPGYETGKGHGYPVLYMPDGGIAEDFPHVAKTVDALVRQGNIPPMLVVGIENTQRRRDLTGPTEVDQDRGIAPVVGGSAAFRAFIADELKPLIGKRYAVNDKSAIMGESVAALFIVETLFLQPDLFDIYIALDPSLWWNNEQWTREAGARLEAVGAIDVRLLLASADDNGNRMVTMNLVRALCAHPAAGLHWTHAAHPELRHDTIYRSLERQMLEQAFSEDFDAKQACNADTPR